MQETQATIEWWAANGSILFESLGILAFALSGLLEAARKKLDLVGMAMVAALAAFGGGRASNRAVDDGDVVIPVTSAEQLAQGGRIGAGIAVDVGSPRD